MNLKETALYIASLTLFAISIYAHLHESRYTNWLPVVTYPFRVYAIPVALVGVALLVLALIVRKFLKAKDKTSTRATQSCAFTLVFLITGFAMKIVGETVHELLGHGSFVLLFGGQVTDFYISLLWPVEFSYVGWSLPSASLVQRAFIISGGILVSSILSYSIQTLLLLKQFRWSLSVPLFWLSFWCYINATGYLIIGGVSPFGDVEELIHIGVTTSYLAAIIGTVLFLAGFFFFSEILRRTLTTFLKEEARFGILAFWCIIPVLVTLTLLGREMFHIVLVLASLIPILLSYLLEFHVKAKPIQLTASSLSLLQALPLACA